MGGTEGVLEYSVSLPWLTRLKIVVDAAKGPAFLHCEEPPIICHDFKASNILLDSDYSAKVADLEKRRNINFALVADFGQAMDGPQGVDAHVIISVMGTESYAAPEYLMIGVAFLLRGVVARVQKALVVLSTFVLRVFHENVVLRVKKAIFRSGQALRRLTFLMDQMKSEQPRCPQLYIYSSADKVIPAEYVESFIVEQQLNFS
ncbi:hypothetical protein AgCh_021105 [Apium graveolens]